MFEIMSITLKFTGQIIEYLIKGMTLIILQKNVIFFQTHKTDLDIKLY